MESSDLKVIEVSHQNRTWLFHDAIEASKDDIPKSQGILAQLQIFHQPTSQDFVLKEPDRSIAPFRLLDSAVSASQEMSSRHRFQSYIAVSYCWHSHDWALTPSLGETDRSWPIHPRMLRYLLQEIQGPNEGI